MNTPLIPEVTFEIPLPVGEILYDVEQPLIYTTHTRAGQRMLAYVSDEVDGQQKILVAPLSATLLARLKQGLLGVREALTASWLWQVQVDCGSGTGHSSLVAHSDYAQLFLPAPGTGLYARATAAPAILQDYCAELTLSSALARLLGRGLSAADALDYLAPFFEVRAKDANPTPAAAGGLEPVLGDVLPPMGSRVFIRHGRDAEAHACRVRGYYAWPSHNGALGSHRVFVRLVYEGSEVPQARLLRDCWPTKEQALQCGSWAADAT